MGWADGGGVGGGKRCCGRGILPQGALDVRRAIARRRVDARAQGARSESWRRRSLARGNSRSLKRECGFALYACPAQDATRGTRTSTPKGAPSSAFTLIELLVVIAILVCCRLSCSRC
ncbi:type II secretion system protein [Candidatus Parcubacteria bacterium]|nr:MAG: type II secretion system protein [Candidatus Parcubacteria bacterium]